MERNAQERDEAEQRARQAETKSLSLSRELEELQEKLDEADRLRRALQAERDALMESKDDVGKNVSCRRGEDSLDTMLNEDCFTWFVHVGP